MLGTITEAAKLKALIAILSIIALGALYSTSPGVDPVISPAAEGTIDPFTKDIQARSDLVNNAVMEAVNQQGKQSPLVYKQTCESSISFIQGERLDTNTNYNTLDSTQKALIQDYREYLTEAAKVVTTCYAGKVPDMAAMTEAKAKLF
ncbi:MAG: hypothetical protein PHF13_03685 [Acholeplasmataceae bacterium]|nr:hypothetical protein [Acholeplasmataceae bacterium]